MLCNFMKVVMASGIKKIRLFESASSTQSFSLNIAPSSLLCSLQFLGSCDVTLGQFLVRILCSGSATQTSRIDYCQSSLEMVNIKKAFNNKIRNYLISTYSSSFSSSRFSSCSSSSSTGGSGSSNPSSHSSASFISIPYFFSSFL